MNNRQGEPKTQPQAPPCPPWVGEAAAKHWDELVQVLYGLGIMADVHAVALSLLVDALAEWLELKKAAADTPYTTTGESGASFAHPVHGMKGKAWERVLKACREFGMTPSAITAIKTTQAPKKTGLEAFRLAK